MGQFDAYATAAEYRARTGDQSAGTVAHLDTALLAVSRELERSLQLQPGAFNTHTATYYFDGHGHPTLALRDREGVRYLLQAVTANLIGIDSEYDATYDGYALDFDDSWVRGLPENAASHGEPFHTIELLPGMSGSTGPSLWPVQRAGVRITGTWGWAAVPDAIRELVVHRAHELRTALKEGGIGLVPAFDSEESMRPSTAWLWREIEKMYGARIPSFG